MSTICDTDQMLKVINVALLYFYLYGRSNILIMFDYVLKCEIQDKVDLNLNFTSDMHTNDSDV